MTDQSAPDQAPATAITDHDFVRCDCGPTQSALHSRPYCHYSNGLTVCAGEPNEHVGRRFWAAPDHEFVDCTPHGRDATGCPVGAAYCHHFVRRDGTTDVFCGYPKGAHPIKIPIKAALCPEVRPVGCSEPEGHTTDHRFAGRFVEANVVDMGDLSQPSEVLARAARMVSEEQGRTEDARRLAVRLEQEVAHLNDRLATRDTQFGLLEGQHRDCNPRLTGVRQQVTDEYRKRVAAEQVAERRLGALRLVYETLVHIERFHPIDPRKLGCSPTETIEHAKSLCAAESADKPTAMEQQNDELKREIRRQAERAHSAEVGTLVAERRAKACEEARDGLLARIQELETELSEANDKVETRGMDVARERGHCSKLERDLRRVEEERDAIQRKYDDLHPQVQAYARRLDGHAEDINTTVAGLEQELREARERVARVERVLSSAITQIGNVRCGHALVEHRLGAVIRMIRSNLGMDGPETSPGAPEPPLAMTRGCLLAGPGRGDCEHMHPLNTATPRDQYGLPFNWCYPCWLKLLLKESEQRAAKLSAQIQELKGRLYEARGTDDVVDLNERLIAAKSEVALQMEANRKHNERERELETELARVTEWAGQMKQALIVREAVTHEECMRNEGMALAENEARCKILEHCAEFVAAMRKATTQVHYNSDGSPAAINRQCFPRSFVMAMLDGFERVLGSIEVRPEPAPIPGSVESEAPCSLAAEVQDFIAAVREAIDETGCEQVHIGEPSRVRRCISRAPIEGLLEILEQRIARGDFEPTPQRVDGDWRQRLREIHELVRCNMDPSNPAYGARDFEWLLADIAALANTLVQELHYSPDLDMDDVRQGVIKVRAMAYLAGLCVGGDEDAEMERYLTESERVRDGEDEVCADGFGG